jgi:hypothetical protein
MIYHLNKCSCGATITGKNRVCFDCEAARNVARINRRRERERMGIEVKRHRMTNWQIRLCADKIKVEFCPICGTLDKQRRHTFCSRACHYLWMSNVHFVRKTISSRPFTSGCYLNLLIDLEEGKTVAKIAADTNRTPEQVSAGIATAHRLGREGIRRMFIQERAKDGQTTNS